MSDVVSGIMLSLVATLSCIAGYQMCKSGSVDIDELRFNGYEVVRHSETRGDFHTNWVEVVRKDGKPL